MHIGRDGPQMYCNITRLATNFGKKFEQVSSFLRAVLLNCRRQINILLNTAGMIVETLKPLLLYSTFTYNLNRLPSPKDTQPYLCFVHGHLYPCHFRESPATLTGDTKNSFRTLVTRMGNRLFGFAEELNFRPDNCQQSPWACKKQQHKVHC